MPTNYLTATRFVMLISSEEAPELSADVFKFDHPTVTIKSAVYHTSKQDVPVSGSKIEYGDLDLTFIVDGKAVTYIGLYDWLLKCLNNDNPPVRDVTVLVYGINEQPAVKFTYKDAFIENLGSIGFNAQDNADAVLTCTVKLKHCGFEVSPV